MNKFSIIAETEVVGWSAAEAREALLRRFFKDVRFHASARPKAEPETEVDSQLIDETGWKPDAYRATVYDLAASHPHVLAASLFSRKSR
jgi:hypothetical protein